MLCNLNWVLLIECDCEIRKESISIVLEVISVRAVSVQLILSYGELKILKYRVLQV